MPAKKKYLLRFFKNAIHNGDSYEREVEERELFYFYSMCDRYYIARSGSMFNFTMIFSKDTFIQARRLNYAIMLRLLGKYFEEFQKKGWNK